MKILIVASTEPELKLLIPAIKKNRNIDFIVTGIGMVTTAYELTKKLKEKKYDFALNIGIAGSFNKNHLLGDVVNVIIDRFSEMGAENGTDFIPFYKLNLEKEDKSVFKSGEIINNTLIRNKTLNGLKKVKGITVNSIHGNDKSIKNIINIFNPDTESMEGAAFMYICKREKLPFAQIRSISNYVDKRNKANWNITLALENLYRTTIKIIADC